MAEMNKIGSLLLLLIGVGLGSCSDQRLFEEFYSFKTSVWAESDTAVFALNKSESLEGTALIGIRFNESYPFSNCYVRMISRDSSHLVLGNVLLNVPMFDSKSGQPLGEGFGNSYTKYDTLPFTLPAGTREVLMIQYMRKPQLEGIEAVGLKIAKTP